MKGLKKCVALLQVCCLVITLIPAISFSKPETVEASVSGITNNGTYQIVSAYNGKALTYTDLSTFWCNAVVWNNDTQSDLAKWTLTERGEFYSITNIVSGKSMKICGTSNGSNCDFNGYDNSNDYKWTLEPITSGTYAGCYYICSSRLDGSGNKLYVEITSDSATMNNDGAQVRLWNMTSGEPRQIWRFEQTSATTTDFTLDMSNTMLEAFKNKYYQKRSTGYDSLGEGFWGIAEVMESMLDGYETTGNSLYKTLFVNTYNDFIARNGDYWTSNNYNDDISWASIMSVRAYLLFGEQKYLDIAVNNFNFMYNRASTFGSQNGLLRWCEEDGRNKSSNACINGPATVCACYLGIATGDESYWEKARRIYLAQRNSNLYVIDGDQAGRVKDCINEDGSIANEWTSTYNQATYLGSAVMLYEHFGDSFYSTDADNIMNYTYNHLCYNGILKEENTNSGDLSGFRGILPRYIRKYIVELQHDDYLSWFKNNAKIAWMNRNSANLSQCSWQKRTSENVTWDEFAAYNSISLMANMPTYSDSIYKDAYSRIEAEDLDYCKGLISESKSDTSGGRSLGGVQNNHYSAYYNVQFGSVGADKVSIRYSKATESDASATAEIRLDSPTGTLLGSISLAPTGNWETWTTATADITKTTGTHNIYVVYKTTTSYACNVDYLEFSEAIVERDGFARIEAESEDNHNGITNNASGTVGDVTDGKWVEYDYVRFDKTATSFYTRIAVPDYAGGTISVYLDSMDSTPIATAHVSQTGSNWESFAVQKFDLTTPVASGRYNIFFKFTTDTGKGWVADIDYFQFCDTSKIQYSNDVDIEGYQISPAVGGFRIVASSEPQISNSNVTSYGLIYGLASTAKETFSVSDSDMVLGSTNSKVYSYVSKNGTVNAQMGDSSTASYYVMTMTYGQNPSLAFTANYLIRAYATLEDGSIVYSDVYSFTVNNIADYLYRNRLMNSSEAHDYLYNTILSVVTPGYTKVDYDWGGAIVK